MSAILEPVRFDPDGHRYWRGDKELTSVSRVLRLLPDGPLPPQEVLDNAARRGIEVDSMLCSWLGGQLTGTPVGVGEDSRDLFLKLADWWDGSPLADHDWRTQVILSDGEEIAGTADLVAPSIIADLKATYDIMPKHGLQLGAYCHLHEAQYGRLPDICGIVHVTKRFDKPRWVPFEVLTVVSEFRVVLAFWKLVQRKTKAMTPR